MNSIPPQNALLCVIAVLLAVAAANPARRAAAAELPSPANLPGLVLWLDASDAGALREDTKGISEWHDKSGKGNHVRQPVESSRPALGKAQQNGLNLITFDGATDYLTGPAVLPAGQRAFTFVAVWQPHTNGGAQSIVEQAETPMRSGTRAALLAVGGAYGFNGESNDCHTLVPFQPNAWRLTCLEVNDADPQNVAISDNGTPYVGVTQNPGALKLGTSGLAVGRKLATDGEYLQGDLAEILIYDRALPREKQQKMLWYLDRKWGLDCLGWLQSPDGRALVFDFEGETYGDWKAEGEAFGPGPARGTLPGQMPVTGFLGKGLVNSFHNGDGATGKLTSPPFVLERKYLSFLIGGGKNPGDTCMNLLVDGKAVRTATGPNDKPGGSEQLDWQQWDVSDLAGKTGTFQIVDRATGGWGHINADHLIQTDRRLPVLIDQTRELTAEKRYLNLPVKNGAAKRLMRVLLEGAVEREFEIELADAEPDWWAFMDLAPLKGKALTLQVERLPDDSKALELVEQGDTIKGAEDLYREKLRPQFHFTTRRGWNNDPNGLVFYDGEYHLFYQHNPYGINWGNMHWGHAVSKDLLHWEELPWALYPDKLGPMFSGSAVVDWNNTAGMQTGDQPAMFCIYTAAGNPAVQCIAASNDRGRTWTKYEKNPVLPHLVGGNRDPKVIWYAPEKKWVMALFLDGNTYALFSSPDLKQWERLCAVEVPDTSECPEFFEIALDGNKQDTRWVFYGGNGHYLVGRFDGKTFTPESGPHPLHHGNCFYASQTFTDIPPEDGRRILIAWGTVGMPGMPFNQMMSFPVELTLRTTPEGPRLFVVPAREVEKLHGRAHTWKDAALKEGDNLLAGVTGDLFDLRADITLGDAQQVGFVVRGTPVTYDVPHQTLSCRGSSATLKPVNGTVRLQLLVDRTSLEVFGNGGAAYLPRGVIPPEANKSLEVFTKGGSATVNSLEVYELQSAWGVAGGG